MSKYITEETIQTLENGYSKTIPFPHIVIDNFLNDKDMDEITICVNNLNRYHPNCASLNEDTVDNKFVYFENFEEPLKNLINYLLSDEFVKYMEKLTGIKGLIADNHDLYGAGIHKITNNGFLAIHTDFNIYNSPTYGLLDRRINLLLYLNDNWKDEYNGHLILCGKNDNKAHYKIRPNKNRCVIFNTTNKSLHGHPEKLNLPSNKMRESIALYYYTKNNTYNDYPIVADFEGDTYHGTICYDYSKYDTSNIMLI